MIDIKIICKNWNNLGFDTMIISENNKKVKYVGYTKKEAIKLFKESSIKKNEKIKLRLDNGTIKIALPNT